MLIKKSKRLEIIWTATLVRIDLNRFGVGRGLQQKSFTEIHNELRLIVQPACFHHTRKSYVPYACLSLSPTFSQKSRRLKHVWPCWIPPFITTFAMLLQLFVPFRLIGSRICNVERLYCQRFQTFPALTDSHFPVSRNKQPVHKISLLRPIWERD